MTSPRQSHHTPPQDHLGRGISLMLLATVLFSIADALGKQLTLGYPFVQIIWLRSIFGIVMIGSVIIMSGKLGQFGSHRPRWHLARSVVGILLTTGIFTGLKYIPLAEVTAIVFATPLIVAVYSSLFLREQVKTSTYAAIVLGFVGVLLVVRPTPAHFHVAHLLMLGFALASAFMSITARRLSATESVLTLNFYVYPLTALVSTPSAIAQWQWPDTAGWALFLAMSMFATMALFCVTKAMHAARPAQIAPFDYARILWTLSIGYLVWGEFPDHLTWLGIVVIVLCGLFIVIPRKAPASP